MRRKYSAETTATSDTDIKSGDNTHDTNSPTLDINPYLDCYNWMDLYTEVQQLDINAELRLLYNSIPPYTNDKEFTRHMVFYHVSII